MKSFSKSLLVVVDAGLLLYWCLVITDVFPESMRFRDYSNQVIQAWNWSFFPLDVAAALTVFVGAFLIKRHVRRYRAGAWVDVNVLCGFYGDIFLGILWRF